MSHQPKCILYLWRWGGGGGFLWCRLLTPERVCFHLTGERDLGGHVTGKRDLGGSIKSGSYGSGRLKVWYQVVILIENFIPIQTVHTVAFYFQNWSRYYSWKLGSWNSSKYNFAPRVAWSTPPMQKARMKKSGNVESSLNFMMVFSISLINYSSYIKNCFRQICSVWNLLQKVPFKISRSVVARLELEFGM